MKSANSFAKQLKRFVKEGNSTYNKSSILKNIKIQNIYSNDKINKKEHYIYFKEQDIKPNDLNYTHLKKTKRLFKNGANKNKNVFMYTTISSSVVPKKLRSSLSRLPLCPQFTISGNPKVLHKKGKGKKMFVMHIAK